MTEFQPPEELRPTELIESHNDSVVELNSIPEFMDPQPGYFQRFANVIRATKKDVSDKSDRVTATVAATGALATLAWEVGPGNETMIPRIGRHMLELGHTGVESVVKMVAVTGGYTFAQQLLAGGIMTAASLAFRNTAKAANDMIVVADLDNREMKELSLARQIYYSFFFGSGFTVTRELVKAGENDPNKLIRVAGRSAILAAGSVGTVAAVADIASDNYPDQPIVNFLVYDVVGNPWATGIAATLAISYDGIKGLVKKQIHERKTRK